MANKIKYKSYNEQIAAIFTFIPQGIFSALVTSHHAV